MNLFIGLVIAGIITIIALGFFGEKVSMNLQWAIGLVWILVIIVYSFGLAVHLITF